MKQMMKLVMVFGLAAAIGGCVMVPVGPPGHAKHRGAVVMAPAPVVIAARPHMVFMTEFGVSFAPDLEFDVYEVGGVWYSFRSSTWYRGDAYDGPWVVVKHRHLPKGLAKVKPGQVRKFYFEHEGKKNRDRGERGRGRDRRDDD
jgi:predicted membrane channel-forming protein YqfA (hemolysin III family)